MKPSFAPLSAALAAALFFVIVPLAAIAQEAAAEVVSSPTRQQADKVIDFLNGTASAKELFAPSFLQSVPPAKIGALRDQLVGQLGAADDYVEWHDIGTDVGYGILRFAKGQLRVELRHTRSAPNLITELLFKPVAPAADAAGPDALLSEFSSLPGETSLAAYRLDSNRPQRLFGTSTTPVLPLGSVFKLWVMAELDAEIRAGTRHWSDVVTLDAKSIPSGTLQNWPDKSPLTLHSLAALMISISDNSAADLLIDTLGRDRIADRALTLGWIEPKSTLPMLKTVEMAALKSPEAAELAAQWEVISTAERRNLLRTHRDQLRAADVDISALSEKPIHSGTIEWFADANMLARLAEWFAKEASPEARAILAINPGMVAPDGWAFVGYKGGSETGVLAAVQILCRTNGSCYAVIAQWHDKAKSVDLTLFSMLVSRAAAQLPER